MRRRRSHPRGREFFFRCVTVKLCVYRRKRSTGTADDDAHTKVIESARKYRERRKKEKEDMEVTIGKT